MNDMKKIPIYRKTGVYAREHGEREQYKASNVANVACRAAIEEAIRKSFDGMNLKADAAEAVIREFGTERVQFVLANTVQQKDWDGRFSRSNKAWAATFNIPADVIMDMDRRVQFTVTSHPAVLDGFISMVREAAREQERPSVRSKLQKQEPHTPRKPPSKKEAVR